MLESIQKYFDIELLSQSIRSLWKKGPPSTTLPQIGEPCIPPGVGSEEHNGFVNCDSNDRGLKAQFFSDDACPKGAACRWENSIRDFEGYPGLIHGGVSSSLMDELMAHAIYLSEETFGLTVRASTSWYRPLRVGNEVIGKSRVIKKMGRLLKAQAYLFDERGKVACEMTGVFYLPTESQFKRLIKANEVPEAFRPYFGK